MISVLVTRLIGPPLRTSVSNRRYMPGKIHHYYMWAMEYPRTILFCAPDLQSDALTIFVDNVLLFTPTITCGVINLVA
jgi:hypothetical protein